MGVKLETKQALSIRAALEAPSTFFFLKKILIDLVVFGGYSQTIWQ
jgi:hypothetical protein